MINENKLAPATLSGRGHSPAAGKRIGVVATAVLAALLLVSCGKKSESTDEAADSRSTLEEIARKAMDKGGEGTTAAEQKVEAAGYQVKSTEEFPSYWTGATGSVLLYADKKGKSGGVVYGIVQGGEFTPVWHWFFEGEVPASVKAVELNDDGLWDVSLTMASGKKMTFTQDKDFSMRRPGRSDWIAENGASSPAASADAAMWKCFDGDSTTVWRSPVTDGQKAFIVLPAPFGIGDGVLTVRTADTDQPRHGTVYADGRKVQDFELEKKAASQMLKLGADAKDARSIRLEFDKAYGGDVVAVAELGIK